MKKNIHPVERVIRVIGGFIAASSAFWGPRNYWIAGIGVVAIITGSIGWCPTYAMLGISTCPKKSK